jgi:hypothetical protein
MSQEEKEFAGSLFAVIVIGGGLLAFASFVLWAIIAFLLTL